MALTQTEIREMISKETQRMPLADKQRAAYLRKGWGLNALVPAGEAERARLSIKALRRLLDKD